MKRSNIIAIPLDLLRAQLYTLKGVLASCGALPLQGAKEE